jgi:hypothetical protein
MGNNTFCYFVLCFVLAFLLSVDLFGRGSTPFSTTHTPDSPLQKATAKKREKCPKIKRCIHHTPKMASVILLLISPSPTPELTSGDTESSSQDGSYGSDLVVP